MAITLRGRIMEVLREHTLSTDSRFKTNCGCGYQPVSEEDFRIHVTNILIPAYIDHLAAQKQKMEDLTERLGLAESELDRESKRADLAAYHLGNVMHWLRDETGRGTLWGTKKSWKRLGKIAVPIKEALPYLTREGAALKEETP